jgi:hypothetical protein
MSLAIGCYLYEASENKIDNDELNRAMLAAWGKSTTRLGGGDYTTSQPMMNELGAEHMAFQRTNYGSQYVHQEGQTPYFKKEPTQQNMKAGVNIEQAKPAISAYNLYSWLFNS